MVRPDELVVLQQQVAELRQLVNALAAQVVDVRARLEHILQSIDVRVTSAESAIADLANPT